VGPVAAGTKNVVPATRISIAVAKCLFAQKLGAKSFGDGSQDIPRDKESN